MNLSLNNLLCTKEIHKTERKENTTECNRTQ